MTLDSNNAQIGIERRSPSYWRVIVNNPPFNICGPDMLPQLGAVVTALETDPHVKVVVFESAVPGFFSRITISYRRSKRRRAWRRVRPVCRRCPTCLCASAGRR